MPIGVNDTAVSAVLNDLDRVTHEIDAILNQLEAQIEALSADWTGDAREAYARAHRAWDADIRELHRIVGALRREAAHATTQLSGADKQLARSWR